MINEKHLSRIYTTKGGVKVKLLTTPISYNNAIEPLVDKLNYQRGALFTSGFEYPGRYTRWDIGFVNPPVVFSAKKRNFSIEALNQRGEVILKIINHALEKLASEKSGFIQNFTASQTQLTGTIKTATEHFAEEFRSKQPSIFSLLRSIIDLFYSDEDEHLGLFGAFGYDLTFQFEALKLKLNRDEDQRDLVLYLPDELYIVDHQKQSALIKQYDFQFNRLTNDRKSDVTAELTTENLPRIGEETPISKASLPKQSCDHAPGQYQETVFLAKKAFKQGDLFEVVPSQTFYESATATPAEIFRRLRVRNPAPYASLINLGEDEYLVGASPEMFVRVIGKRVETCPISGTIARGTDAISDAEQILTLLNSVKDESELTMCTDVDRNDKSRICEPGSVRVIGRRQIEMYSRLIHTVDHVEGILRPGFDALDAFLSHIWVVTVTGAPKLWAMQFIENHEKTPRRWYGGAIGLMQFNGDINTGLTLRTIRIHGGVAEVRVGATLLYDSDPAAEEQETILKASAFIDAIKKPIDTAEKVLSHDISKKTTHANKKRILLVDHQDSFVHTLANYLRQTGAEVATLRSGFTLEELTEFRPDIVVLSPGPGSPKDFNVNATIKMALQQNCAIFGVCLGLQALVEYFGGELKTLDYPMHGKSSQIQVLGGKMFAGLPKSFNAGRYHSLYANKATLPAELIITAESNDGIIMAIEHQTLPIAAVQFHPESIMSLDGNVGLHIISNVLRVF